MVLGGLFMLKKGIVVYSAVIGKAAQFVMVLSLICAFFYEYFDAAGLPVYLWLLYLAVGLTICALVYYGIQAWKQLKNLNKE